MWWCATASLVSFFMISSWSPSTRQANVVVCRLLPASSSVPSPASSPVIVMRDFKSPYLTLTSPLSIFAIYIDVPAWPQSSVHKQAANLLSVVVASSKSSRHNYLNEQHAQAPPSGCKELHCSVATLVSM